MAKCTQGCNQAARDAEKLHARADMQLRATHSTS